MSEIVIEGDDAIVAELRAIAENEGRPLAEVVDDAFQAYVAARRERPRPEVLEHLDATVAENAELYRRLAQ